MGGSAASRLFELVLLLVAAVIVLELVARKIRLPAAGTLTLGGIALALIPGTPDLQLDPDLTLVLFLPPLLLASAYFTSWRDFRADLRIILQLAVGAVAFTTLVVGVAAHLVLPGLPWAACFALGAIVSPPDAVAAKAVLHGVALPKRMVVLLEGESLVNDASGLVLYRLAVTAALTGAFSVGAAATSFVMLAVGGIVAGVAFGVVINAVFARLREPSLAIAVSFLGAWFSYIGAEAMHVSGVLATVTCGLIMGSQQHRVLDAATRLRAQATWGVVVFVLESLVFILIGLSLRSLLGRLGGWSGALHLLPAVLGIVAWVVISRFLWIVPTTYLARAVSSALRRRDPYPPLSVPLVMSWAGMRGVVSLAAALALPDGFPGRDVILAATFAVILATVLLQGATLAPLIRWLQPSEFGPEGPRQLSEHEARARMAQAQLQAVEARAHDPAGAVRHPRLLEQYGFRARAAARFSEAAEQLAPHRTEHFAVVLAAVAAARAELLRLHREERIEDEVLRALEQELDFEEMNARRVSGA